MVTEVAYTLSGQSLTSNTGSITPADVMGLTGQEAVSSVGQLGIRAYQNIVIDGNTSYTDVTAA